MFSSEISIVSIIIILCSQANSNTFSIFAGDRIIDAKTEYEPSNICTGVSVNVSSIDGAVMNFILP